MLTANDCALFEELNAQPQELKNAIQEAVNAARDSLKAAGFQVSYSDPHAALDAAVYRYMKESKPAPAAPDADSLVVRIAALIRAQSGCTEAQAQAAAHRVTDPNAPLDYSPWRHGGWYVGAVRYPSGACGCVSRNYPDKKWRIACDERPFETAPTFPNRDAAARAEQALALAQYTPENIAEAMAAAEKTMRAIAAQRRA